MSLFLSSRLSCACACARACIPSYVPDATGSPRPRVACAASALARALVRVRPPAPPRAAGPCTLPARAPSSRSTRAARPARCVARSRPPPASAERRPREHGGGETQGCSRPATAGQRCSRACGSPRGVQRGWSCACRAGASWCGGRLMAGQQRQISNQAIQPILASLANKPSGRQIAREPLEDELVAVAGSLPGVAGRPAGSWCSGACCCR